MLRWAGRTGRVLLVAVFVCLAVSWALSYWYRPAVALQVGSIRLGVSAEWGRLLLDYSRYSRASPDEAVYEFKAEVSGYASDDVEFVRPVQDKFSRFSWWGIAYENYFLMGRLHTIKLPLWMVLAVMSVPLIMCVVRARRSWKQRRDAEACGGCGYDLRGTPERCPECGWARASGKIKPQDLQVL